MDTSPSSELDATSPKTSLAARMFNVFASPGEVFAEIKASERSFANWLAPVILASLLAIIYAVVVFSQPNVQQQIREAQDKAFEKQVANGKMKPEQADMARQAMDKFGPLMMVFAAVAGVVMSFVWLFTAAFVLWLLGTWACKHPWPYGEALEVAGLAGMIGVLGLIVQMLLVVTMGNMFASPSPALFLHDFDPTNKLHKSLMALNVVNIWYHKHPVISSTASTG